MEKGGSEAYSMYSLQYVFTSIFYDKIVHIENTDVNVYGFSYLGKVFTAQKVCDRDPRGEEENESEQELLGWRVGCPVSYAYLYKFILSPLSFILHPSIHSCCSLTILLRALLTQPLTFDLHTPQPSPPLSASPLPILSSLPRLLSSNLLPI